MSRLAKSPHVVFREGSENMSKHGGPRYVVNRLAVLAEIARENKAEGDRLARALYAGLLGEVEAFGDGESKEASSC